MIPHGYLGDVGWPVVALDPSDRVGPDAPDGGELIEAPRPGRFRRFEILRLRSEEFGHVARDYPPLYRCADFSEAMSITIAARSGRLSHHACAWPRRRIFHSLRRHYDGSIIVVGAYSAGSTP